MEHIAVIGAGAMGGALVNGLLASGFDAACIALSNPHKEKLEPFSARGVATFTDNCEAVKGASLVVLAVKPWLIAGVIEKLRGAIDPAAEVAAIVAGVSSADLKAMWANKLPQALSIVMPNTAMALGQSMTFIVDVEGTAPLANEIFARTGSVMTIEECLLPAATALASCGIAYAMRYVRASVEGGVELGFRAADAQRIVVATLRGAAALLDRPGTHAEAEIDKVTTPGGLTIRGLNAMEAAGFTPAVLAALRASR